MLLSLKKQKFENLRNFKNSFRSNKFLLVGDKFFFKNYFFFKLLRPHIKTSNRYKFSKRYFKQKFSSKTFRHPKYFKRKRKSLKNLYKLFKCHTIINPYYFSKLFLNYFGINVSYINLLNKRINFREIRPYQFLPFFTKHKNPHIHKLLMLRKRHQYNRRRVFKKTHLYSYYIKKPKSPNFKSTILCNTNRIT